MTATTDTRERILDTAERLFQQRGYTGFSYKDIAGPLGIRNAAVHYHFPCKADLGQALIERYRELLRERTREFMEHGGDARAQLEGYLAFTLAEFDSGAPICTGGMLAAGYEHLPEPVRDCACRLHSELHAWLTKVLRVGREQGSLTYDGDPSDRALMLIAAAQGARQVARYGGRESLVHALELIRRDLGMTS